MAAMGLEDAILCPSFFKIESCFELKSYFVIIVGM